MTDREWLERVISDALTESLRDGRPVVACLADAVERVRLAAPAPTSPPLVWPGLEGEGLERAAGAFRTAYDEAADRVLSVDDARRAAYTATTRGYGHNRYEGAGHVVTLFKNGNPVAWANTPTLGDAATAAVIYAERGSA